MLSFAPPIFVIEGHAVFSDSVDPNLFYVAPRMPRLAVDDDGNPLLSLTQYMSTGDSADDTVWGGFLSLSTTFGLETERLSLIHEKLKQDISVNARVAPLPFHSGDVSLILLGQEMEAEADTPDEPQNTTIFDLDILGSGKPSLDGQGLASFQVSLNGKSSALLEQAIKNKSIPALINYTMTIEGLRPAFHVKVTADWSHVYKELQQKLKANVYYVRADLENTMKETFQDVGVKIETIVEEADSVDDAIAAEKILLDWALNVFFKPSHNQNNQNATINGVMNGIGGLIDSMMPGVSLKLKQIKEEEVKTFSAQLDRTIAERRVLTFDGTVGNTLTHYHFDEDGNELSTWNALLEKLVLKVDVPDDPRLAVTLSVLDRFQLDGLSAVIVDIARKDGNTFVDQEQFHFSAGDQKFDYVVSLLNAEPEALGAPYYYRVRAKFDPSSVFGSNDDVTGEWIESRSQAIQIDPRVDTPYAMTTVSLQSEPGFPFNQFEEITVELRVPNVDDNTVHTQHHRSVLDQNKSSSNWQFRSIETTLYEYRVTYLKPPGTGDNIVLDWVPRAASLLTIPNPASASRRVNIINNLPWERLSFASLEIKYDDDDKDIHINEQIPLDQATRMIQRSYAIARHEKQGLLYRLTALFTNGQFLVGDWRETIDTALIIGGHLVEERHIRVILRSAPITNHGLKNVKLDIEALDDTDTAMHTTAINISGESVNNTSWSYPLGNPPLKTIRVKAKFIDEDGFSTTQGWHNTKRDLLIVDPENKIVIVE